MKGVEFLYMGKDSPFWCNEKFDIYVARKDGKYLCMIDENIPYMPFGGKQVLQEIINTTEEGKCYHWKTLKTSKK